MGMTDSYLSILDESLDNKLQILDKLTELTAKQSRLLDADKLETEEFHALTEEKALLIEKLESLDNGFQLIYDKVKEILDENREAHSGEIAAMQKKIAAIMEQSSHLMAEESRNKAKADKHFALLHKEVKSVKMNQQYAANYYKTMNKVTGEPVFMDKKK